MTSACIRWLAQDVSVVDSYCNCAARMHWSGEPQISLAGGEEEEATRILRAEVTIELSLNKLVVLRSRVISGF
jgi:hypothetical protein